MSSEKTADIFNKKSEEEIINWMMKSMTPEQITSCFDSGEVPDELSGPSGPLGPLGPKEEEMTVDNLRKICANKRYVIHKIEKGMVYFWYYLVKKQSWQYSIESIDQFPKTIGEQANECGDDTAVEPDFENELKEAYNQDKIDPSQKFDSNNENQNQSDIFNKVKNEYKSSNINKEWVDTLLTALHIQQSIPVLSDSNILLNFAPVLIESVSGNNVNYYYLVNSNDSVKFVEANLTLDKFQNDLIEIIDDLKLPIKMGDASTSDSKTVDEWKKEIQNAANNIYSSDLDRIKEIYTNFPLSKNSPYFMKNLFNESSFGEMNDLSKINLSEYVKNKYGSNTAKLFKAKIISNNFGSKTIALS